jgi:hypothetical protein
MKAACLLVPIVSLFLAGCYPRFVDNPPERTISGTVLRADTGVGVTNAVVDFHSGRKSGFSILPWDNFGIDASTHTDAAGRFTLTAKLNPVVHVLVQNDEFAQIFDLPPFPESNRIDGLVWRLSEKKPVYDDKR